MVLGFIALVYLILLALKVGKQPVMNNVATVFLVLLVVWDILVVVFA